MGSGDAILWADHPILGQAVNVLNLDYPNCYESQDAFSSGCVERTSLPKGVQKERASSLSSWILNKIFSPSAEALITFTDLFFSTDVTAWQDLLALFSRQQQQTVFNSDFCWLLNTFPCKTSLIPSPWINWSLPSSRRFPPIPPHYLQSLALANWLFIFAITGILAQFL